MDSNEIEEFLRGDRMCRGRFQGVFSVDTLPENPRLLICNTDPSTEPGLHWIAIFVDQNGRGEFFDSFGRKPPDVFADYMNAKCIHWIYNTRQLQSFASPVCGQYCLFYCSFRCRGFDLNRIVNSFTRDVEFNDSIVRVFVCNKR